MNKYAIFGLSGDAPTLAHQQIVQTLSDKGFKVIVCPSGNHRTKKNIASFVDRVAMCELVFTFPNVNVNTFDLYTENGSTYELMELCKKATTPSFLLNELVNDYYIVIGEDNAINIDSFYKSEELLKYPFIVFGRDSKETDAWYHKEPNVFIEMDNQISSSLFRETKDDSILPKKVVDFVKEN